MGRWDTDKTPPLAHFVGAPDKVQNMKYVGFWNYDADALYEWVLSAMSILGPDEDDKASKLPMFSSEVIKRLEVEGVAMRSKLPTLLQVKKRHGPQLLKSLPKSLS